jgi:hypothetical protein
VGIVLLFVTLSNGVAVIGTYFLCRPRLRVNSHEGEIKNRTSPYSSGTSRSNQVLSERRYRLTARVAHPARQNVAVPHTRQVLDFMRRY